MTGKTIFAVKENGNMKLIIWVVGIVFLTGIAFATIHFNAQNIAANNREIIEARNDVKGLAQTVAKINVIESRQQAISEDIKLIKQAVIKP